MPRFKIGDKVKIVGDDGCGHCFPMGSIGEVKELQDFGSNVRYEIYKVVGYNNTSQIIYECDLKKVEETMPKKRKTNEEVPPCQHCGEESNDLSFNGKDYCQECYEELFEQCDDCGEMSDKDSMVSAHDRRGNEITICEDCGGNEYFNCEDCDEVYHDSTGYEINRGSYTVCRGCYGNEGYFHCENCGENFHGNDYAGEGMCQSCHDENREEDTYDGIHSYDYKPTPKFFAVTGEKERLFMGVELEIECEEEEGYSPSDVADYLAKEGELYCKTDGSLRNGVEIVTHPMTLSYHENFKWDKILKKLSHEGCKSHNVSTCGLHVHVNKNILSQLERIRLGIFVNLHNEKFEQIARRKSEQWARFKKVKGKHSFSPSEISSNKNEYRLLSHSDSRYEALNWNNSKTVEFRLFKGTLKYETFIGTLEIIHSSINFIKQVNTTLELIKEKDSWELYTKFLLKNKERYSRAIEYLKSLNLIKVEEKTACA